jgi:hypothetical protein
MSGFSYHCGGSHNDICISLAKASNLFRLEQKQSSVGKLDSGLVAFSFSLGI